MQEEQCEGGAERGRIWTAAAWAAGATTAWTAVAGKDSLGIGYLDRSSLGNDSLDSGGR